MVVWEVCNQFVCHEYVAVENGPKSSFFRTFSRARDSILVVSQIGGWEVNLLSLESGVGYIASRNS